MAPGYFEYLRNERGLSEKTIILYRHYLRSFEAYLQEISLNELTSLSPVILSGFVKYKSKGLCKASLGLRCTALRVFLRYLYRERIITKDLCHAIDSPRIYRLSSIPRSITWDEVNRMLEAVDCRTAIGKRDYAILLLMVTYGIRAREVAALTLDDIDWRKERLLVPERKANHSTAYPLSPIVGQAILDYLQHGRPKTSDRHIFFRTRPPYIPMAFNGVSTRVVRYLRKAGVHVDRVGSHTLRHTCVQRLVDASFSLKSIGDYVGHGNPKSTEIYAKVAVDALREIGSGLGEDVL
nr:site-specific integrase [Pelotomaculum propionicicum]